MTTTFEERDALAAVMQGRADDVLRQDIAASWHRVAQLGLDPERFSVPNVEVDDDAYLTRVASPVAAELASDVTDARNAVLLTDGNGVILERWAIDRIVRRRLDDIFLAPGFTYGEAAVGTNAIGTALFQRAPSTVFGGEHFANALMTMACAAVPIRDPRTGRIVGALDLTCEAADAALLMLPLVRRAAQEIERRIVDDAGVAERALMQRFLDERRRTRKPFVLLNDRTLITSAAADRILGPADEDMLRRVAAATEEHPSALEVTLANGTAAVVTVERSSDDAPSATLLTLSVQSSTVAKGGRRPTFGLGSVTDTERSVMELVAQGLTNRQVAEKLFMSRYTVDFHLRGIFRKLAVTSRVELTRLFLESRTS